MAPTHASLRVSKEELLESLSRAAATKPTVAVFFGAEGDGSAAGNLEECPPPYGRP